MKIKAYKCDNCNEIKEDSEVMGIHGTQDLFDGTKSYPFEHKNNDLCEVHCCTECYRLNVVVQGENQSKDKAEQQAKKKDFSYILRHKLIAATWLKQQKAKPRGTMAQKAFV